MPETVVETLKLDAAQAEAALAKHMANLQAQAAKAEESLEQLSKIPAPPEPPPIPAPPDPAPMERLVESHGNLSRAEMASAHGIEMIGHAMGMVNPELGEGVAKLGETVQYVGMATHAYHGMHTMIETVKESEIAMNLVSGPVGWVTLAAAVVGAGVAYLALANDTDRAAEAQKRYNEEREKIKAGVVLAGGPSEEVKLAQDALTDALKNQKAAEGMEREARRVIGTSQTGQLIGTPEEMRALSHAQEDVAAALRKTNEAEERLRGAQQATTTREWVERLKEEASVVGMDADERERHALATANMSVEEKRALRVKLDEKIANEELARSQKLETDQLENQRKQREAAGGQLWEQTRTAAERYEIQLDKINELEQAAVVNHETAERGRQKAAEALLGNDDRQRVQFESAESIYHRIAAAAATPNANDPQVKAAQAAVETEKHSRRMADGIDRLVGKEPLPHGLLKIRQ
jgi:hypothetical protein